MSSVFVVCWMLDVGCLSCLLVVGNLSVFVLCALVLGCCCLLFVVCCLFCVVCCMLVVARVVKKKFARRLLHVGVPVFVFVVFLCLECC